MNLLLFLCCAMLPFKSGGEPYSVFHENGRAGLKDDAGTVLIPADYEAIGWSDGTFSLIENRITGYELDDQWGLIDLKNTQVSKNDFAELYPADNHLLIFGKQSPVSLRMSYGVIDESGKVILSCTFDGIKICSDRAIVMRRDGTRFVYGLITLDSKQLIPSSFRNIYPIGSLRYAVENFDGKTALFSENGKQVSPFMIDSIASFSNDLACIYSRGKVGLVNRQGLIVVSPSYKELIVDAPGSVLGRLPNVWQFWDPSDRPLDTLEADSIRSLAADRFEISKGGQWFLTGPDFHPITPDSYRFLEPYINGLAIAARDRGIGILNKQGDFVLPPRFDSLVLLNGFIRAKSVTAGNVRWELYDSTGVALTQNNYQFIGRENMELFPVEQRKFWGLVNRTGNEIVSCVYDSILAHNEEQAAVKFRGQYGIITLNEQWLVPPQQYPLRLVNTTRYIEIKDSTWMLESFDRQLIYFSTNPYEIRPDCLIEYSRNGGQWQIDYNGRMTARIVPPLEPYEKVSIPSDGFRLIRKDGKCGFIDEQGRLMIANRYEDAQPFLNGLAPVKLLGHWGFIDKMENIAVQPLYDQVSPFIDHVSIVARNHLFGVIDDSGQVLLPLRYERIERLHAGRFLLVDDGLFGIGDVKGDILLQLKYQELRDLDNGYVIARLQNKYGVVSLDGISTIPALYDAMFYDAGGNRFGGLISPEMKKISLR